MRHLQLILLFPLSLGLLMGPNAKAAPLGAEEFDRYTQGRTLFYGFDGVAYGVERYLPGRRVIWSFLDGRCQDGEWYPKGDQICFVYDAIGAPQCWVFTLDQGGLVAQFEGDPEETQLYEADEVEEEMICLGPEVGV